jgi:hypothetical protein
VVCWVCVWLGKEGRAQLGKLERNGGGRPEQYDPAGARRTCKSPVGSKEQGGVAVEEAAETAAKGERRISLTRSGADTTQYTVLARGGMQEQTVDAAREWKRERRGARRQHAWV